MGVTPYSDLPPREIYDPARFARLQEVYIEKYWKELFDWLEEEV